MERHQHRKIIRNVNARPRRAFFVLIMSGINNSYKGVTNGLWHDR